MNQSSGILVNIASFLIILVIAGYVLIIGKFIIVPIIFAALLAMLLQPICSFIEKFIHKKIPAILITFLVVLIPITGVVYFFSSQLTDVIRNMPVITDRLQQATEIIFTWLEDNFGVTRAQSWEWLKSNFSKMLDTPVEFFKGGLISGTTVLINILLVIVFIFFFLLYRGGIKNFLLQQFKKENREEGREILLQIQKLTRRYLYGMFAVIAVLALLNSIGLSIIGINYAVFWACLAALLSIIPYIGTTIGGLLPFLYALATATTWWQPVAVVGLYFSVQQIEGNLLTPYIVGSNVKLNPFIAIVALLIGGVIWGLAGIVLSLPLAAILKLIFDHVDTFKPLGALMSNDLHKREKMFLDEWDNDKFRITSLFRGNK